MENVNQPDYIDRRFWQFDPMTGQPLDDKQPQRVAQVQVAEDYHAHVVWLDGIYPVAFDQMYLYIAPPQREWQGLTNEEVTKIAWSSGFLEFAEKIEAKLKEKNA